MNIEFKDIESLLLDKIQRGFLWVSGHNIFVNQSVYNLILCVFLLKDTSLNIYCWFINGELTAHSPAA